MHKHSFEAFELGAGENPEERKYFKMKYSE